MESVIAGVVFVETPLLGLWKVKTGIDEWGFIGRGPGLLFTISLG
jgi:hypothetical protein